MQVGAAEQPTDVVPQEVPADSQVQKSIRLDTLEIKLGFAWSFVYVSDTNGGVAGLEDPDENGNTLSFVAVFNNDWAPGIKPYVDYARMIMDDRYFTAVGLGVRHDFKIEDSGLEPYLAGGIGYYFSQWDSSPVPGTATGLTGSESFGGALKGGVDWYFTDNLALSLGMRWDFYSQDTTVIENNTTTTIRDKSSISLLAGLVYRFGSQPKKTQPEPIVIVQEVEMADEDSDADGIVDRFDRCPDTLFNVPVNENGCPYDRFALNLDFEFNQFKIDRLTSRPNFSVVAFLYKHPDYHVHITGHGDYIGSEAVNMKISRKRAQEAMNFLLANDIRESRIKISAKGATEPIASNKTAEGRAMNRRIYVEFIKVPGSASVE
jgi:outer membrane protein OmpA-like peptidoglycan-associated protein